MKDISAFLKSVALADSHTHIHSGWNLDSKTGFKDYREYFKNYRARGGYDFVNVLGIPYLRDRDVSQNIMAAILKLEDPHFFAYGGFVYPDQPISLPYRSGFEPQKQVDELMEIGFDGIKMLETQPNARKLLGLPLDSMSYDPLFTHLEERGIHFIWHVNNPESFWHRETFVSSGINPAWCYADGGYLSYEEIYGEVYNVLRRHPLLCTTFAHLFFMSEQPDRLEALLETYPNVRVDLTPGVEMYFGMSKDPTRWKSIFMRFSDRILFGTDTSTYAAPDVFLDSLEKICRFLLTEDTFPFSNGKIVHGLGLDASVVRKILSDNFLGLAGEKPKPINKDALAAYIKKYTPFMTHETNRTEILRYLDETGITIHF